MGEKGTSVLLPRVIAIRRKVGHLDSMREGLIFLLSFKFTEFSKSDSYFLIPVSEHLKVAAFFFFFLLREMFVL